MSGRFFQIAIDHLVAELIACPLSIEASFTTALHEIFPDFNCGLPIDTKSGVSSRTFYRAVEREFIKRFPHLQIDELVSIRNLVWFDQTFPRDESTGFPLDEFFRYAARNLLRRDGNLVFPRLAEPWTGVQKGGSSFSGEAVSRRAWRWLTLSMPADLLVASLCDKGEELLVSGLVSPLTTGVLREGFAETHLHLGVGFDFSAGWSSLMCAAGVVSPHGLVWDDFRSPGAVYDEGLQLSLLVVRCAVARFVIASFLRNQQVRTTASSFASFLTEANLCNALGVQKFDAMCISDCMTSLLTGEVPDVADVNSFKQDFSCCQSLYSRLSGASRYSLPTANGSVLGLDPVHRIFFNDPTSDVDGHSFYLRSSLSYLRSAREDQLFSRLFWQCERIRCMVYRHCVIRPLTPGLANFIRYYQRKRPIARPIENTLVASCAKSSGVGFGLRSLEVRTSPLGNGNLQLAALTQLNSHFLAVAKFASREIEYGVVLHFLKFRGKSYDHGFPPVGDWKALGDPTNSRDNPSGYRFSGWYTERIREANAIAFAVRQDPSLLSLLRGVDLCRDEVGIPTWVAGPIIVHARRLLNSTFVNSDPGNSVSPGGFRTTVHVGEDWVHLSSALRMMDEAIDFCRLSSGDRIGHGLALGVDAHDWSFRTSRVAMSREDRFFDLIWEKTWHSCSKSDFTAGRMTFVDREIERLAFEFFGPILQRFGAQFSTSTALEFRRRLFNASSLADAGFPLGSLPNTPPADVIQECLEAFLTCPYVYQRLRIVEWVDTAAEGGVVNELQKLVRNRYADIGITIEVNPVCNLLVSDLGDLSRHPLWRLAPSVGDSFGPSIRMCVGSDDPFVLSSNLMEEYQVLADSLLLAGRSQADVRAFLETLRRTGMEARFT